MYSVSWCHDMTKTGCTTHTEKLDESLSASFFFPPITIPGVRDTSDYRSEYLLRKLLVRLLQSLPQHETPTQNCRFISFTVSLATLSERPARFQRETECSGGVIIYCRTQALIFTDMLYSITPFFSPMSISTPHIRTRIIIVSMAMLLVGLLTGHFETQQLSVEGKKTWKFSCCLLFVAGGEMRVYALNFQV